MPAAKEIRNQIKSVKNTQKITKAMEMVAASKMRRAQERMSAARPYGEKIREVCAHLARSNSEYRHPFLTPRDNVRNVGFIVVTSDKGLCGGLNTNALRSTVASMREKEAAGLGIKAAVLGNKGAAFLGRLKTDILSQYTGYGDAPEAAELIGAVTAMLDSYRNGDVDEVHLVFTRFINTVKQDSVVEQLLPISDAVLVEAPRSHSWDYLYEPEAAPVVNTLLTRFVEAVVYQAVAENIASEQAARMVAMKAASDNAGNLIDELQLVYNKSRQASITQEIAEIVGGAAAV
ncbi:F0F1 ATP synthase subunit gamma [Candidatus Persebacteraceae bacterium Df01]|jgi:F-type H+-transporting ATPase subunit gamma|uniref:ATP synthase gamma chain n=1 Tax=Candidatus Doriopsillibacter californiensis TaxID=2970740 RepID=A0ABT7QKJ2_9GAMM|nr:F0F1 ATP synthase subunit gamma [Candidatus Persebacteraceae bacterium Df01]